MDNVDNSKLTNEELIKRIEDLAGDLRTKTVELVESLVELDERKLYFNKHRSLFEYCVFHLKMSDGAAYRRIRAARAFQTYPPVKALLRSGQLSLESLAMLHPFLNDADAGSLVAQAAGMRVWEVERLVAPRRTEAPRRDVVRFIPAPTVAPAKEAEPSTEVSLFEDPVNNAAAPNIVAPEMKAAVIVAPPAGTTVISPLPPAAPTSTFAPISAARASSAPPASPGVRIAFTADAAFFKLMREAQSAMRHKYPDGRLDGVFGDALILLLRKKTPYAFRAAKP